MKFDLSMIFELLLLKPTSNTDKISRKRSESMLLPMTIVAIARYQFVEEIKRKLNLADILD